MIVVAGVATTVCVATAPYISGAVSQVMAGTASPATVAMVTQAATEGTVIATVATPYAVQLINQMAA